MRAFVLLLLMTAPALAQDTAIDVDVFYEQIRPYLLDIIGALAFAAAAWVAKLLRDKFGIEFEAKNREALQSALANAAKSTFGKVIPDKTGVRIEVGNQPLADGVEYVLKSVPDAVKYFNLTPERIRAMLEPHLIEMAADKTTLMGEPETDKPAAKPAAKK